MSYSFEVEKARVEKALVEKARVEKALVVEKTLVVEKALVVFVHSPTRLDYSPTRLAD